MKKIIYLVVLLLLGVNCSFVLADESDQNQREPNTLYQIATISALAQGVYDGDYHYGKLMKQGNLGVGTFLALNGEMVAVDGNFYQIESSGKLQKVNEKQIVPFAEVIDFKPTINKDLAGITSYQNLGDQLLNLLPNKNIPYAIRIDGTFKSLKLRSLVKQSKPYPTLAEAAKKQAIFNLNNVKGSMVGFWFPKYWEKIAVPGFHLHFVTDDRTTGGHVLEVNLKSGKLQLEPIHQINVYLPNTPSFAKANLSADELNSSIKQAEGGHR